MNKRLSRVVVAYVLVWALQSCAAEGTDLFSSMTPSQVNALTSEFNGRAIQVRGYFVLKPGGQNIYESKSKFREFAKEVEHDGREFDAKAWSKYCLTIANPAMLTDNLGLFANRTLVIKGTFVSNYRELHPFDLAACPLPGAILIDEGDLKARYPGLRP